MKRWPTKPLGELCDSTDRENHRVVTTPRFWGGDVSLGHGRQNSKDGTIASRTKECVST